jgi:hypothetical protein
MRSFSEFGMIQIIRETASSQSPFCRRTPPSFAKRLPIKVALLSQVQTLCRETTIIGCGCGPRDLGHLPPHAAYTDAFA